MKTYGLIGNPLTHSFSKQYFTQKFENEGIKDSHYELFPIEKVELLKEVLAKNPSLVGLNVTIPYKESVIDLLDELDKSAEQVGAVNTIQIKKGKLIGYNTDIVGFELSLQRWLQELEVKLPSIAFILGTGGAAKAVQFVLKKMGCEAYFVSRNNQLRCFSYDDFNFFLKTNKNPVLVINATPLGTFPNVSDKPNFDYKRLKDSALLYDLVYNPEQTAFMEAGLNQKCNVKNGLEMLQIQAEKAWEIWQK